MLNPAEMIFLKQKGIEAAIMVGVLFLLNLALRVVLHYVHKKHARKPRRHFSWLSVVIQAIDAPLRWYLWTVVAAYALDWVFVDWLKQDFLWFFRAELIATLALIAWALVRLVTNIENFYINQVPKGAGASFEVSGIKAISRMIQIVLLLLVALMVLAIVNVPISGLMTFGGVSGIAVAYAGKGVLTNFFGGIMIYMNRQFSVGDQIASPDRNIEGTVERIDWRYTTIRTPDKQLLYVPNGVFIDIIVINRSRMSHRKIEQTVTLRYEDILKIPQIFTALREFLLSYKEIDPEPGIGVHLSNVSNSSLSFVISVYALTLNSDQANSIQDTILLKAFEVIDQYEAASPVLPVVNK